ncbi:hypothetical protein BJI47_10510 [Rhodococcus sp. 1168]|nr:hypothetical protein BJI47_10510 [Rhodococcus sp. 1168]
MDIDSLREPSPSARDFVNPMLLDHWLDPLGQGDGRRTHLKTRRLCARRPAATDLTALSASTRALLQQVDASAAIVNRQGCA